MQGSILTLQIASQESRGTRPQETAATDWDIDNSGKVVQNDCSQLRVSSEAALSNMFATPDWFEDSHEAKQETTRPTGHNHIGTPTWSLLQEQTAVQPQEEMEAHARAAKRMSKRTPSRQRGSAAHPQLSPQMSEALPTSQRRKSPLWAAQLKMKMFSNISTSCGKTMQPLTWRYGPPRESPSNSGERGGGARRNILIVIRRGR